jgi:hypothetical protein
MAEEQECAKATWPQALVNQLLSLYIKHKDLLEARHSITITEQTKARTWVSIADALIASTSGTDKKTVDQIKKKIRDMKMAARKWVDAMKKPKTGGGRPPRKPFYIDIVLDNILGSASVHGIDGM